MDNIHPSPQAHTAQKLGVALLLGLALSFSGLHAPRAQAPAQTPAQTPVPNPTNPPAGAPSTTALQIASQVESLRGLPLRAPLKTGVKTRDELRKIIVKNFHEEYSDEDFKIEANFYVRLGMLAPDIDFQEMLIELLVEQIAGFYDHKTGELYIIDVPAGTNPQIAPQQPVIIAHEVFHAIQDQHYDIETLQTRRPGLAGSFKNGDRALARSALIEGDATVVMFDFAALQFLPKKQNVSLFDTPGAMIGLKQRLTQLPPAALGLSPALANTPIWLQQLLAFPYLRGMLFAGSMRENNSWAKLHKIYSDPPESTEQILHPERYQNRDEPTLVALDNTPIKATLENLTQETWLPIYENVLGEWYHVLWLKHHLENNELVADHGEAHLEKSARPKTIEEAAAGWDGDRIYLWESSSGRHMVIAASIWDSPQDASQYTFALAQMTRKRYPAARYTSQRGKHGELDCFATQTEHIVIERWHDWVVYTEGLPLKRNPQAKGFVPVHPLHEAVWETRRTGTYPSAR